MSPESKVIWILQKTLICLIIPLNTHQQRVMLEEPSYISRNVEGPRIDLNIYTSHELESTFIEIINPKKSNIVLGVVYRHPTRDLNEFNDKYLNKLLANIAKENKTILFTRRL